MALKLPGPLAPGVSCAKPVMNAPRLSTGATATTDMQMSVVLDFTIGLAVSEAEADLYLHWAGDLLAPAKDDDDGNGPTG